MKSHEPTSAVLDRLLADAAGEHVTIAWLLEHLDARSFGLVALLMGLVGLIPGVSSVMGVLLAIPAIQMMLARSRPAFPGFVLRRQVPTRRLERLIARVNPVLRRVERVVRPRWRTPSTLTKRVVGFFILLLGAGMLIPIPFSQFLFGVVLMVLSLAFLEEDGILLCVAIAAAAISVSTIGVALWATVMGIHSLGSF
jgi:hypothetical protein